MYKTTRNDGNILIIDGDNKPIAQISLQGHARFGGGSGAELLVSHLNDPIHTRLHGYRAQQTGASVFGQQRRDLSNDAPVAIVDPAGAVIADVTSAADAHRIVRILNEGTNHG